MSEKQKEHGLKLEKILNRAYNNYRDKKLNKGGISMWFLLIPGIGFVLYGLFILKTHHIFNLSSSFQNQPWTNEYIHKQGLLNLVFGLLLVFDFFLDLALGNLAGLIFLVVIGVWIIGWQIVLIRTYKKKRS